jgi:multicomponent Na+:H+ antiporter subunit A
MEGIILFSLILVFSGAVISPLVHRFLPKYSPWLLSLLAIVPFISWVYYLPQVSSGAAIIEAYPWVESLGFRLQFRLDGLGLLFVLLINGIGTLIVIYGGTYLSKDKNLPKFYSYLFIFMGSMMGVVLSDNIFALFIFWELTSLSSYLLIGYKHGYAESRRSALQALLVTGFGGLALMAGLILLANAAGSANISEWAKGEGFAAASPHYIIMLVLLLLGAFTKSAQFPFHFWLPSAMVAPTPVSAYLHSATMVKAGVYLLARLNPYFEGSASWQATLVIVGGFTMLFGVIWALFQSDLKKILAYSTISSLGLMVFFIGIGTAGAVEAAMVFLLAHALYKGGLFMVAGNVDHSTGTRDIHKLSGLFAKMKYTGVAAVLTSHCRSRVSRCLWASLPRNSYMPQP